MGLWISAGSEEPEILRSAWRTAALRMTPPSSFRHCLI